MGISLQDMEREGLTVRANGGIHYMASMLNFYANGATEVRIYPQSELEPPGEAGQYVLLTRRKTSQ